MCIRVEANSRGRGTGTHVSLYVYLMRGEYDDSLHWPFRGAVTLQLINQRMDSGHVEDTVPFDYTVPSDVAARVTDGEMAPHGQGRNLIPHSALKYDKVWNTEYLRNDSLEFQVPQVATAMKLVSTHNLQPSRGVAQLAQVQRVPPVTIIMSSFVSWKVRDFSWLSPPFYSHKGGYKMSIRVDANGQGNGAGTHVSVSVDLMRGESDSYLSWPFEGIITLQLVNQRADAGHVERSIIFNDSIDDVATGRVVNGELASAGRGYARFIAHSALCYDQYKNTEYLKNDSLKLQVTRVEVCSSTNGDIVQSPISLTSCF